MSDVLCVYYSRTGNTRQTMREIAGALDADILEIRDGVPRSGWRGWLRCGLDAMRKNTTPVRRFETQQPLESYRLVIVGTPIWAGRCSAVVRSFLKEYGGKLNDAAYVLLRGSEDKNEDVFEQLDLYVPCGHCAGVSLRRGSVGYTFWQEEFLRQVRECMKQQ